MPDTAATPPVEPQATLTCGNCGVEVRASDVMCPSCGGLLAAYKSYADSTTQTTALADAPTADTSATRSDAWSPMTSASSNTIRESPSAAPTFSTPTFRPPSFATRPAHQPRTQSPIGDALRKSRATTDRDLHHGSREDAAMLADMADQYDELADMASGNDELARMASGGGSTLAEEVEAELAGAKVRFDGSTPVITHDPAAASKPEPVPKPARVPTPSPFRGDKAPAPQSSAAAPAPSPLADMVSGASTPRPSPRPRPVVTGPTQQLTEVGKRAGTPPRIHVTPTPGNVGGWVPLVAVGAFVLVAARGSSGVGAFIGIVLVLGLIFLLLRWTASTSRKTTTMPRDDKTKRRRR